MTVSVNSIIDRVQRVLQDTTGVRWPVDEELVLWVNDAQREIALLKPDASAVNETLTLVAGTKQSIPTNGNRLLKVVRNVVGTAPSSSIRLVDGNILDSQTPDWHNANVGGDAAHSTTIKHYIYNDSNPRNFYVYPGALGATVKVDIIYSANPTDVFAASSVTAWDSSATYVDGNRVSYGSKVWEAVPANVLANQTPSASNSANWAELTGYNISIPDIYANSIMNYVLYMAYMKDAEFAGSQQRAGSHYQLFQQTVTGKGQIDAITTPNAERTIQPVAGV